MDKLAVGLFVVSVVASLATMVLQIMTRRQR